MKDTTIKAWAKFNDEVKAFGEETGEVFVTLYEDAFTTRQVANFKLCKNGKLTWVEMDLFDRNGISRKESEMMFDDDDAKDWLKFWKANLRRARKYWSMNTETLDAIQEGEKEDIEIAD